MAADDGEGVEDVGGVFAGEAVEVEVEGVEAGAQVAALFLVPDEGRAVVAEGIWTRREQCSRRVWEAVPTAINFMMLGC